MNWNKLAANRLAYMRLGIDRAIWRSLDSRVLRKYLDVGDASLIDQLPPEPEVNANSFEHKIIQELDPWDEQGFIYLSEYFEPSLIEAINQQIAQGLSDGQVHFNYTGRKIFNAQQQLETLRQVTHDPVILKLLHYLFGREARHFQTINFLEGSEQRPHSDAIHMSTVPEGYLIGVWVALQDIGPEQGPLLYFPGSHKLPYIYNTDYGNSSNLFTLDGSANAKYENELETRLKESGLKPSTFQAKAGDVFIWHANLVHGGAPISEPGSPRKSMVSHYFAKDVLCYHEISERVALF